MCIYFGLGCSAAYRRFCEPSYQEMIAQINDILIGMLNDILKGIIISCLSLPFQFLQQYRHYQSTLQIFQLKPANHNETLAQLVMFLGQVMFEFFHMCILCVQVITIS